MGSELYTNTMNTSEVYDAIVVGGGPAGMTAAVYTARLGHSTVLINAGGGRAVMMKDTHNMIGITETTSGAEFVQTGSQQLEEYGVEQIRGKVVAAETNTDGTRTVTTSQGDDYTGKNLVLATGFSDKHPDPPLPPTGRGLHYCLHCDAYMFRDESVYVMGHSESAAKVAMIMLNFADNVDLLLREDDPTWSEETDKQLRLHPIDIIETEVSGIQKGDDGWLKALEFEDGTTREYRGGFAMYGSDYNNELAKQLGCELNDDGTVKVVSDANETTVDNVYAVGDLIPGHNQIPVALGEGAKVGIDIHYRTREYPKSIDELTD